MNACLAFIRGLSATLLGVSPAWAAEVHVAVAANFVEPLKAVAAVLEKTTGHKVVPIAGATGKLYAQIKNGAPFEVLLSADQATPEKLAAEGLAVASSRFTYATGKLVLWSADPKKVDAQGAVLQSPTLKKVAYANPKTAPYGAATTEVIAVLGLNEALAAKLVQGESIGQAYTFVASGNAEVGFVAMSQVLEGGRLKSGSMWVLPSKLYRPIQQDAVLLNKGANNPAALALLQLLKSERIKDLIRSYGYEL